MRDTSLSSFEAGVSESRPNMIDVGGSILAVVPRLNGTVYGDLESSFIDEPSGSPPRLAPRFPSLSPVDTIIVSIQLLNLGVITC